jgi:hypothetical protein
MTSRILFVGGDKGAWQMRGKQIAEALGARYGTKHLQPDDWALADVVVLVKRAVEQHFEAAKRARRVLVWDVLDFWRQPMANDRTEADLVREVTQTARALGVQLLIGATRQMAQAIGGVYLPHHHRLGLTPTPPRPTVQVVGYEGSPRYLGAWRRQLEAACAARGLTFVVNPDDLAQVDVLVAFRDREWDGWACRHWKSGIKYVNAIAAGRPILTQPCAAVREIAPCGLPVEDPTDLGPALDRVSALEVRQAAYADGCRRARDFSIQTIAGQYRELLLEQLRRAS